MRTFIVLIPLAFNTEARKQCENIENYRIKKDGSVQKTALDVKKIVIELINDENRDLSNIEVEPIIDFMDRVNNEEFNSEDYFISYVYA